MKSFLLSYFISLRFFLLLGLLAALFVVAFFIPVLEGPLQLASVGLFGLVLVDSLVLYLPRHAVFGRRLVADRLSNGDPNPVDIFVENHYPWPIQVEVIDEIPHQFQRRDIRFPAKLPAGVNKQITYHLRPVKRGTFNFGHLRVFVRSPLGLVVRRFSFGTPRDVAVYPSYLQMRKYELLAIHNQLTDVGIKKIRRLGHNREFEQIKEYVAGDDIRTINWKATARRNQLMVNSYQDEKAQPVYAVIDKGRSMKMPFEGMTLLDYAINAALVISNIAILKSDKAGLVTFQHKDSTLVPASRRNTQMQLLMEALYNQKTAYKESNFSRLFLRLQYKLTQRSLLLLFTNFESRVSMQRQLPYLRRLAKRHVLVVIFFENTEVQELLKQPAHSMEDIYLKGVAEKFTLEKQLIAKELQQHGVFTVLTSPENLTVNTINKYLELKARGIV